MGSCLGFAVSLSAMLEDGEDRFAPATIGYGARSAAAMVLAGFVPGAIVAYRSPSGAIATAFYDLSFGLLALSGIPTAICMLGYSALIFRRDFSKPGHVR
jgi:hypothetical protein